MSPRSSKQFEEIREQSRDKILAAAFELFAKKGYHNTSISQIAKQAGVAKGLIYNYFEKKEDLMTGVVMHEFAQGDDFLAQVMAASPGKDRLRMMFELSFDFITQNIEYQRLMGQLSMQLNEFPDLMEMVKGKYQVLLPLLTEMLRDAGHPEPEKESIILGAIMDGIGLQYIVLGDALAIDEIKNDIINRYCK
ncbi:MAG: TetR/AcrR family transcriptional regulator [Bacteroidota bacterium]